MYNEGSLLSPEDVACYEECVTDEICIPSPSTSSHHGIPKAQSSGRITKRSRSRKSLKERKCSSPMVLKWLEENYETIPGACLPRSVLYTHYQDFCKRNQVEPSSAASFGKIIRLKFPNLTTRRLGTRGQSKYHYYGLAIKETSVYYRSVYSKKGLTRFSGASLKRENGQTYNPSSKTGILLPEFPKVSELNFTKPFPIEKIETFLMMYRAHCQRILDSVVRANFHEVQDFLVHFWQGMPTHMLPILGCQAAVDLIVVCDFILYRSLCEVLIPATLQPLPDTLLEEIVTFSHTLVEWLLSSLQDLPAALGIRKVQTAEMFGKSLRRQTALVQLAKGARSVLRDTESVTGLLNEWRNIGFERMNHESPFSQQMWQTVLELTKDFSSEMEQLFVKQSSLEVYFEWLDSLIERRVSEPAENGASLSELSQDFLLTWNYFYTSVEKEMAIIQGKNFDCFRTLHLVLDEYVNYVIELLQGHLVEQQYNDVLKVHGSPTQFPKGLSSTANCVFPPTPDHTPITSDGEFFQSFEGKITTEYQDPNLLFTPTLHSPGFALLTDSFYDGFIKHELGNFRPACSHMHVPLTPLPIDTTEGLPSFMDSTPLTPQSSHYSTSSPLSHASVHSPDPSSDLEYISQASNSPHGSVDIFPATSPVTEESSSSRCSLAIAASLELVAEECSIVAGSVPPYDMVPRETTGSSPFSDHGLPGPTTNHMYNNICVYPPQYDFQLMQLMSNPDELLADPFCAPNEAKPFSTPPATPIH